MGAYLAVAIIKVFPSSPIAQCLFFILSMFVVSYVRAFWPEHTPAFHFFGFQMLLVIQQGVLDPDIVVVTAWQVTAASAIGVGNVLFFGVAVFPLASTYLFRRRLSQALAAASQILHLANDILLLPPSGNDDDDDDDDRATDVAPELLPLLSNPALFNYRQHMVDITQAPLPDLAPPPKKKLLSPRQRKRGEMQRLIHMCQALLAEIRQHVVWGAFEFSYVAFKRKQVYDVLTSHARALQLAIAVGQFVLRHDLPAPSRPVFLVPVVGVIHNLARTLADLADRVKKRKVTENEHMRWPGVHESDDADLGCADPQQSHMLARIDLGADIHRLHYLVFVLRELRRQLFTFALSEANLAVTLPWYVYLSPSSWRHRFPDLSHALTVAAISENVADMSHLASPPPTGKRRVWRLWLWKVLSLVDAKEFHFALKTVIALFIVALPFFLIPALQQFGFSWAIFTVIGVSSPVHGADIDAAFRSLLAIALAVAYGIPTVIAADATSIPGVILALMFIPYFLFLAVIKATTSYDRMASQLLVIYTITALFEYTESVTRDTAPFLNIYELTYQRVIATVAGVLVSVLVGRIFWPFIARVELRKVVFFFLERGGWGVGGRDF